jgi:hypothetical protein
VIRNPQVQRLIGLREEITPILEWQEGGESSTGGVQLSHKRLPTPISGLGAFEMGDTFFWFLCPDLRSLYDTH